MLHRQTANAGLLALPPMTAQIATALGPALDEPVALQQPSTVHVRFGSKADIRRHECDVRFAPKADIGNLSRLARCGAVSMIIPANMRRAAMRFLQSDVQRYE
jgi:hypothetical protein